VIRSTCDRLGAIQNTDFLAMELIPFSRLATQTGLRRAKPLAISISALFLTAGTASP
jgi:hypothetical protein